MWKWCHFFKHSFYRFCQKLWWSIHRQIQNVDFITLQPSGNGVDKAPWIISQFQHLTIIFIELVCLFLGISNTESRQPGKAPNFSVNWAVDDTALEVINAMTGKDDMGRPSRLCKHALYSRWLRLHAKVWWIRNFLSTEYFKIAFYSIKDFPF